MGLNEKRQRFYAIKGTCRILVSNHAFKDYPERGFSKLELINLVKYGQGRVTDNPSPDAIDDSFLFFPKDEDERECKLVLLMEEVEIERENGSITKETILVFSAYREV